MYVVQQLINEELYKHGDVFLILVSEYWDSYHHER